MVRTSFVDKGGPSSAEKTGHDTDRLIFNETNNALVSQQPACLSITLHSNYNLNSCVYHLELSHITGLSHLNVCYLPNSSLVNALSPWNGR